MAKERLKYIDIAKGLGIFLVVWGHLIADGFIDNLIYSFHMPLFLFLSGYLLRIKNTEINGAFVKKLIKQLIIPYFAFSVAYLFWELLVNKESLVGLIYLTYQTITFRGMAPLWFLASLFFAELFFLAILKLNKKLAVMVTVAMGVAHVLFGKYVDLFSLSGFISNPLLFLVRTSLCVPFLACGYGICAMWQKKKMDKPNSLLWCVVFCVMLALCGGIVAISKIQVNVHLYKITDVGLFVGTAVAGAIGILALSMAIKEGKILERLGRNSMLLMALHYPITQILKDCIRMNHWAADAAVSFAVTVLLIALLDAIIKLAQKIVSKHSLKVKQ